MKESLHLTTKKEKNILENTPIKTLFDHIHPYPFQETINKISITAHNKKYFIDIYEINDNNIDFEAYITKEEHPHVIFCTHKHDNVYEIGTEYEALADNKNFTTFTHHHWKTILFSVLKREGHTEHEKIMLLKNITDQDIEKFKTYMTHYLSLFKTINTNKTSFDHYIKTEIAKF